MVVRVKKEMVFIIGFAVLCMTGCDKLAPKAKVAAAPKVVSAPVTAAANSATALSVDEKLPKDVLAVVGDWTLTVAEFDERVKNIKQAVPTFDEKNPKSRNMLVEELIRQQLMVHEARQQKLNESAEFRAAQKDFENNILVQQLVVGLTKDVKATEEEAQEYYDKNPNDFIEPAEKQVSEIVVSSEAEAKEVLVLVLQGADFAQTAKDRSKGKTASDGGDLGFLVKPAFEQMEKAVGTLDKGGVSGVFQGPDGYYIVKVVDVRGGSKVSLDKIKADLIKGLTAQKQQQVVLDKMAEIAKKVKVNVNGDLLNVKTGE